MSDGAARVALVFVTCLEGLQSMPSTNLARDVRVGSFLPHDCGFSVPLTLAELGAGGYFLMVASLSSLNL